MELPAKSNNTFIDRNLLKLVCHSALHSVVSQTKVNIFLFIQIYIILKGNKSTSYVICTMHDNLAIVQSRMLKYWMLNRAFFSGGRGANAPQSPPQLCPPPPPPPPHEITFCPPPPPPRKSPFVLNLYKQTSEE